MNQRNTSSHSAKVLKFRKRLYDGGSEIALIQAIEAGRHVASQLKKPTMTPEEPKVEEKPAPAAESKEPGKGRQITDTLLMGPLELVVALVGILTAGIAIATFTHFKNEALLQQSRNILRDCGQMLMKGLKDTLHTPGKVMKLAMSR